MATFDGMLRKGENKCVCVRDWVREPGCGEGGSGGEGAAAGGAAVARTKQLVEVRKEATKGRRSPRIKGEKEKRTRRARKRKDKVDAETRVRGHTHAHTHTHSRRLWRGEEEKGQATHNSSTRWDSHSRPSSPVQTCGGEEGRETGVGQRKGEVRNEGTCGAAAARGGTDAETQKRESFKRTSTSKHRRFLSERAVREESGHGNGRQRE